MISAHSPLWRLVYRSDSCIAHTDTKSLDEIFRVSVANNRRDAITGCLALPDRTFIQVIEGSRARVEGLIERIRSDARHQNMTVLGEWPIQNRLFSGWAMARPDPAPLREPSFRIAARTGSGGHVTSILSGLMERTENQFRAGGW